MRPPRPDFDWTRLNDGEMPLEEMQRIDAAVSRPADEYGGVAADQVATGYNAEGLIPAGLRPLWVRLTSLYTAEGPLALYNFEQVIFDDNAPVTVEGGVTGVALETSGNDGLVTGGEGEIVQVWPGEDSLDGAQGEKWRFTSDKGGTGDTFNYTDETFNYYGTTTVNVYDTFNWTINAGGTWYVYGPGYFIVEAPFKIYGGLWLNYRTHDFSGASQVDDLGIDTDDPQRVVLRITLDQNCKLTGLVPTANSGSGQVVIIPNTDPTFTLTLASMNFASAGGNRIACPGFVDLDLTPGSAAMLWYDVVSFFWRVIGFCCGTGTGGGGGGGSGTLSERSFYQTFRWYYGGHPPDVLTSSYGTLSSGLVYAFPFLSGPGAVVDEIGCLIGATVGSGASLNLGIYDNLAPGDYRPHNRLYDSGPLSTATSTQIKAGPGLGITLDPDTIYWLVIQASSSSIQPRSASCNDMWPILGSAPGSVGGAQGIGWSAASSGGGALASTWPTSTSVYAPNNTTGAYMIGLSFSSVNGPSSGGGGGGGGGPIDGTTATTLTGILQGDGSVVGTVTIGAGLSYSGGTLSATGGGSYTDEQAQDAVANALIDSLRINWTYNDAANQISADIFNYSITDQQIRYAAGTSVIGRAAGGASGPVADIAATADGQVLTRVSGALTWAVPATGGTGTVTSVAATAPAAGLTISGSPITTSGTLTFTLADDLAALEALTGTNTIYYRSGTSTWSPVFMGNGLDFSGGGLLSVPAMTPAGASHAPGLPPDPGATAHTPPYVLCDDVTWRRVPGTLLGTIYVVTQETWPGPNSAWNDCPTVQSVTFTLASTTNLLILANAQSNSNTVAAQSYIGVSLDGAAELVVSFTYHSAASSWLPLSGAVLIASVAAGTHTVKLRFLGIVGTTQYGWRSLTVLAAN